MSVGGGEANPQGFLGDVEGGIGGVDCCQCFVTLVWVVWAPGYGHAGGDTIDSDFGPFDIGPRWQDGGVRGQLEFA